MKETMILKGGSVSLMHHFSSQVEFFDYLRSLQISYRVIGKLMKKRKLNYKLFGVQRSFEITAKEASWK